MARSRDGAGVRLGRAVAGAVVGPSLARVRTARAGVASSNRQPGLAVTAGRDVALARIEQSGSDAGAAMAGRDEHLFGLVADHRHEADDCATVGGDRSICNPVSGPRAERSSGPNRYEVVRHVAEVTVPPAVMPNLCHDGGV